MAFFIVEGDGLNAFGPFASREDLDAYMKTWDTMVEALRDNYADLGGAEKEVELASKYFSVCETSPVDENTEVDSSAPVVVHLRSIENDEYLGSVEAKSPAAFLDRLKTLVSEAVKDLEADDHDDYISQSKESMS